jgi:hypothetical protein
LPIHDYFSRQAPKFRALLFPAGSYAAEKDPKKAPPEGEFFHLLHTVHEHTPPARQCIWDVSYLIESESRLILDSLKKHMIQIII